MQCITLLWYKYFWNLKLSLKVCKIPKNYIFISPSEIPLANVTKAHLVAYDPDKDFLPMIFAHCDYSLKVGEGTTIDFNWKCLERQVVDRFIRGRPRLMSLVNVI